MPLASFAIVLGDIAAIPDSVEGAFPDYGSESQILDNWVLGLRWAGGALGVRAAGVHEAGDCKIYSPQTAPLCFSFPGG